VADGQPPAAVKIDVIADLHPGRHFYAFIDDRPADFGVATDVDSFKQDRVGDVRVAINTHSGANDAPFDQTTRNDGPLADDAVQCPAGAVGFATAAKNELWRGKLVLERANRPRFVVKVQKRVDSNQVHIRFVIGIE